MKSNSPIPEVDIEKAVSPGDASHPAVLNEATPRTSYSSSSKSSDPTKSPTRSELERSEYEAPHLSEEYRNRLNRSSTGKSSLNRVDTILSEAGRRGSRTLSTIRSRDPGQTAPFSHPLTQQKTASDVVVEFDGPDDPYKPINWNFRKKVITTVLYGLTTMAASWASAIFSAGVGQVSQEFHVGREVGELGVSLLLCGFGIGPLIWAPLSELYGRKPAVLAPYFIAAIFSIATATAKDIQTVEITRFFCGFFAAAPITNTGGVLGDIWSPEHRGAAIVGYAFAVILGPLVGPIAGGAIVQSYLGWRWTEYITGIMMFFFLALDVIFIDETYPPKLLVNKARRLRFEGGNWALHARHEEWDVSFQELLHKYLLVPFALLTTPICFLVACYASFVYGILYLNLAYFPVVYQEQRGWNQVVGQLPFLALLIGIIIGGCINLLNQKFYISRFRANNNRAVPEARLPPMMLGSIFFAAGNFIFGWTSPKDIHWIGSCIGAACMGIGFFTVFQSALNYLIDTFPSVSASAVAANTFLRSCFAAAFPLFGTQMAHGLTVPWASSLLGFISVALIPIPYLFYVFGLKIRSRGTWSRASVE